MAIFDGIPDTLDVIRQEPILLAAVCAVGSRASSSREADLHQKCLTEARSLISSVAFGPAPSLLALRGIMLICAWYRSDRLWGTVITLAYEMGLHEDALRLPDDAKTMDRDEIERARTWLSILTYELMCVFHWPDPSISLSDLNAGRIPLARTWLRAANDTQT